jgi:hypothetical protein
VYVVAHFGEVQASLRDNVSLSRDVWLMVHPDLRHLARIRAVVGWPDEIFAAWERMFCQSNSRISTALMDVAEPTAFLRRMPFLSIRKVIGVPLMKKLDPSATATTPRSSSALHDCRYVFIMAVVCRNRFQL